MKGKFAIILLAMSVTPAFAQNSGIMPLQLIDKTSLPPMSLPPPTIKGLLPGADQSAMVQRFGQIISRVPIGAGGLTAWTVEKNGRRVVLYTTSDGQATTMSGIVWDLPSGRNLSDQFATNALPNVKPPLGGSSAPIPQSAASEQRGAALVGKYSGVVPESIRTIDTLPGIKEGNGGQADTLYVIVDPRCPYCRKAYTYTREYVKRGFTIKWIPVVALGDPSQGTLLAATLLQAKPANQAEALRRVLGNKEEIATQPTKATIEALDRNLSFFFAAFQNNGIEQAGVPAAFFLDKRTGKPRMTTGISEMPVIEEVFGKL